MTEKTKGGREQGVATSGAVRQRVVKHLRGLLVPGAIGLSACKSQVVCDPMPPPTNGGPATTTTPPSTTTSPVVCDPMPPPTSEYAPRPENTRFARPPPGEDHNGSASRVRKVRTFKLQPPADPPPPPPVVCDPMPPPPPPADPPPPPFAPTPKK
jgi:hypothetical protein